jgi:hypothetical protein
MSTEAVKEPELREVRYSLVELLAEVETERTSSARAREMIDQSEIAQLFDHVHKPR